MKLIDKQPNELIYMASPFRHPQIVVREQRYKEACEAAAILLLLGRKVFAPIPYTYQFIDFGCPEDDWEFYKPLDFALVRRSTSLCVLQLDGWDVSNGVKEEMFAATAVGIPVWYSSLGFLQVELQNYKVMRGQAFT